MKRLLLFLAVFGFVGLTVCGCGRVSNPTQPENSFYPHTYIIKTNPSDTQ